MSTRSRILSAVLVLACCTFDHRPASAQQEPLSIDVIFDPATRVPFSGRPVTGLAWMSDDQYVWPNPGAPGSGSDVEWTRVDAVTGRDEPLFDRTRMRDAIAKVPGVTAADADGFPHSRDLSFNPSFTGTLLTIGGDLYYYAFGSERPVRLTYQPGTEEEASFSPDGRLVAFVRGGDLHVVDVASGREYPITQDGSETLLNGKLDWVYQEELYGRDDYRAYWWSPDSSRVAFLQLDDRAVPSFTVVDHIPYHQDVETWPYPKAGDPNPVARLGIAPASGGSITWVDTVKYAPIEFLIVSVDWNRQGTAVVFEIQDREQTWLDLNLADPADGRARTLLRETSKAWVNRCQTPKWLADGSFLWLSERTGWKHLYRYAKDGTLAGSITSGQWEVRSLDAVDEARGWIYFSGTERSHIGLDAYRVKLDGTALTRLSEAPGTHKVDFNPAANSYIDSWSDVTTPPQIRLHHADGREWRAIDLNTVDELQRYRLAKPEFLQVKTRDGFLMEAMMIRPPDFDPTRRYPVYQFAYGGPHAPEVQNEWGGSPYMYHQLLAQQGLIVWICDNRTASGKGVESTWPVYRDFGELELRDIEDGLTWLKAQPYVDASRIGLHGWSFGGFLTSYALTHSTTFVMGIAGGIVSDWRDYDTIYTERFMGRPETNPEGYRKSSPRFAAANLHGKLLLIHGTTDDNVHVQNTLQFVYELQRAGKPFELMLYPRSRHAVTDPLLHKHLRQTMFEFTVRTLVGESRHTTDNQE